MRVFILTAVLISALSFAGCATEPKTTDSPVITDKTGIVELSAEEARPGIEAAYSQFIDVRTPEEYASGHAYRAINIPLNTLADNLDRLEKNEPVYIICQTSNRSREAAKILESAGFPQIIVIKGGTNEWRAAGMPMANGASLTAGDNLDDKTRSALLAALDDERRSEALYQAMADKFDGGRPFVNIVRAEKRHQEMLLPLFEKYGVAVPKNTYEAGKMNVPATRIDACKSGMESEKKNIAMYDGFFEFVKQPDVIEVFKYLQTASRENHLPAFTRCAEGGGMGRGPGPRGGGPPF